ncbi:MAG: glycosyltransferase [Chitinophagales bacterium]
MGKPVLNIFLYGDIDLNLIDGSSIWMISLIGVLHQDPRIQLTVLLKRPILRDLLVEPYLKDLKVKFINPPTNRLSPEEAVVMMEKANDECPYDLFIVRGFNISKEMAGNKFLASKTWAYITDFPQKLAAVTQQQRNELRFIFENVQALLCQTKQLEDYFKKILQCDEDKFIRLPPMITDYEPQRMVFANRSNRLVYVGKFAPLWYTQETIAAFQKARKKHSRIEFHVAGDKFNMDPANPAFEKECINKLMKTEGLIWHQAKSRDEINKLIQQCDLGISWRNPALNESLEISTKLLEYGRSGKPVILNRNMIHEELLGKDYPFFADSESEFIEQVEKALCNPIQYQKAATTLYQRCQAFTFSEVYQHLSPYLWEGKKTGAPVPQRKLNLLFSGHNLQFIQTLVDHFKRQKQYDVRIDLWRGHRIHDKNHSRECLAWADIIICEWGLGNAVWYSKNKRNDQILFVRMHRQELEYDYPEHFNNDNINKIVTISPHTCEAFQKKFGFPKNKMTLIYNLIDSQRFTSPKDNSSLYHLGLLGYCPQIKRLDRALDIFETLWQRDHRYILSIKGKSPEEYAWLWERPHEREYYEAIRQRIEQSPWGKSVIFEPWSQDVENWFNKIGIILSVSDYESFHLAAAEGMASGSLPVILERIGANQLFPKEFIFKSTNEAAFWINNTIKRPKQEIQHLKDSVQKFVRDRYDIELIVSQWEALIKNELRK